MPNSKSDERRFNLRALLIVIGFLCIPLVLIFGSADRRAQKAKEYQQIVQAEQRDFEETLADLGQHQGVIYLYSTTETGALLEQAKGNPKVKTVLLHKTRRLSDEGVAALATLPNLQKLVIVSASIGDNGLAAFRGNTSLEKL